MKGSAESKAVPLEPRRLDHNGNYVTGVPRGPVVLGLDSAGSGCSVVVASGETVLGSESDTAMHGQAEKLLPMVDSVMRRARLPASALDLIGVTIGPGSFTGIRIGLAAARGIAHATGARVIGVTGFDAVAAGMAGSWLGVGFILVTLESRREDLYVQLFDHAYVALADPTATMPAALNEGLTGIIGAAPLLVAGDAAQRAAATLSQRPDTMVAAGSAPDAAGVLRAALRRWPLPAPSAKPEPLYLRPPDVSFSKPGRRVGR
jgi:tRNA threonylcarbamoyladenosine biosynthesis protein TsaB